MAALLASPSVVAAQQVSAITDYLQPIVSRIAADPNSGGWTWEINRNGGYLVRKWIDVTGDGQPELFIASTLQSTKHEQTWTIFDVSGDGTLRPYLRVLEHSSAWPIVEGKQTYLVYVTAPDRERERVSDEKPYPVYRFAFAFPEIKETLSYASEEEAAKLRPADPGQLPKLQAILLSDYLTKPDAKWSEVTEWKLDANGCFFRPDDKERAAKNTTFTPQAALLQLGVAQSTSPNGTEPAGTRQAALQPIDPKRTPEAKTTHPTPSEEPTSSTPWSIIVVLIVAALGLLWLLWLLWLLFKRRS